MAQEITKTENTETTVSPVPLEFEEKTVLDVRTNNIVDTKRFVVTYDIKDIDDLVNGWDHPVFVGERPCFLESITEIHTTAATGGSTFQLTKNGTNMLATAFSNDSAADTIVKKEFNSDFANLASRTFTRNDIIRTKLSGTPSGGAGILLTLNFRYL